MKKDNKNTTGKRVMSFESLRIQKVWSSVFAARSQGDPDDWKKETSFYRCLLKRHCHIESVKCSIHIFTGHAKLNSCFPSQGKEQHVCMTHKNQKT